MILDYLSNVQPEDYKPVFGLVVTERSSLVSVDYLRCTNPRIKQFHDFIQKFMPLLRAHGFKFRDRESGFNGYTHSFQILFNGEVCGHIAADSNEKRNMGGLIEFTGQGCQLLQVRWDLWCCLVGGLHQYSFKIKRVDIAADCKGGVWDKFGLNMVGISEMVSDGLFRNSARASGAKAAVTLVGDWLQVVSSKMDGSRYSPKEHCSGGLTINVGSSSSRSMWCLYEKGKQMAGKNPDRYDGSLGSWVRFERRLTSGSGRSEWLISFDFLVMPETAFFYECDGVKALFDEWLEFQLSEGVEVSSVGVSDIELERVGLNKGVSLKKTALHVARQSARFFKTLDVIGVDILEFVNLVKHDECTRGFDLGIYDGFSVSAGDDVMGFLRSKFS